MKGDEEIESESEKRLQDYKSLRARLKLPPLADEEQTRQRIQERVRMEEISSSKRQERAEQDEQRWKQLLAAWQHRVLAACADVTIVARQGEVFSQTADGNETRLTPPHFDCALNERVECADLSRLNKSPVLDVDGYAWTREPEIAFFSNEGSRLTVHWVATAHESKYGWEYSHAIVQRVTWMRCTYRGNAEWSWTETVERFGLVWASSTETWTSP